MKKLFSLPVLLFFLGFIPGLIFYFPLWIFAPQIQQVLNAQAKIDTQLGDLRLGSGLGLGLGRGGLLALKGSNVNLTLPGGQSFACKQFTVSPQVWPLFTGRLRFAADCDTDQQGSLLVVMTASPAWAPTQVRGEVYMDGLRLSLFNGLPNLASLDGTVDGKIFFQTSLTGTGIPSLNWDASAKNVVLPALDQMILTLPSIAIDRISSKGRLSSAGQAEIDDFKFGTKTTPIEGSLKGNLTLDRTGQPVACDLKGTLRTDPTFEETQLKKAIDLDSMFGKAKTPNFREFRKLGQGNIVSILFTPALDN